MKIYGLIPLVVALAAQAAAVGQAADWLQFRGTDNTGSTGAAKVPATEFVVKTEGAEPKNVQWSVELPFAGVSSPIIVGDRLYVTGVTGARQERLHVACYAKSDGKQLWQRQFWATGRTLCHPTSSVAANTPASDGSRVYAFFSSNDLVCLDLDGNLEWFRGLTFEHPAAANDVGMAASPLVVSGAVVVQVENKGDSFAAGIDAVTGETLWQHPRKADMNWTSPTLFHPPGGKPLVLLQSTHQITAHDPRSGEEVWSYDGKLAEISSPVSRGDLVILPADGLTAIRAGAGSANWEKLWQESGLSTGSPSAVLHGDRVYVLNRAGVLTAGDIATGKVLWKARVKGPYWATPVAVGEYLYLVNQDGAAHVIKTSVEKGEIVSETEFGEQMLASPAYSDGALYFRGAKHLWKIGSP
ncbi:MAG: PQQ-binding-like beta-propeller repeat protein [Planctomycetes bacterium]|nr:PQQ-binding-like beta-propeller repeat protein [Planctomycetota bacterium]